VAALRERNGARVGVGASSMTRGQIVARARVRRRARQ
jgi:hypothetical protein